MPDLYPEDAAVKPVRFGTTNLYMSPIIVDCKLSDLKLVDNYNEREDRNLSLMFKSCYDKGLRTFNVNDDNGYSLGSFMVRYKLLQSKIVITSQMGFPPLYDTEYVRAKATKQQGFLRTYIFKHIKQLLYGVGKHIDLLQITSWDADLSKEELLSTLTELVSRGDVRYTSILASTVAEFEEWQQLAERNNWTKFSGMQLRFGLFRTAEELEKIRFAKKNGIGLVSWVPSDGGIASKALADKGQAVGPDVRRAGVVDLQFMNDEQQKAFDSLQAIAERKKVPRTIVLAARALMNGCCPVIGCSTEAHVDMAVKALYTELTPEEWKSLEVHLG